MRNEGVPGGGAAERRDSRGGTRAIPLIYGTDSVGAIIREGRLKL